jgi:hypothetical protein
MIHTGDIRQLSKHTEFIAGAGLQTHAGAREGYTFIGWTSEGMTFWAVSDLNAAELAWFVRDWRAG